MIEKKTILDQIEVTRPGDVQFRLALVLLEDGKEISSQWHRSVIPAEGGNADLQIAAVNAHLSAMGWPSIEASGRARIKAVAGALR